MVLKGYQVLAFKDKSTLILSKLNKVYLMNTDTFVIKEIFRFQSDLFTILSFFSSVLRRLFRKDIRYALKMDDRSLLLVRKKRIYRLDLVTNKIFGYLSLHRGSRPLNMTKVESLDGFDDGIYFGEYFANPLKSSVKIFQYINNDSLNEVYEFPHGIINHIHNLVVDKYRGCIWLLAGDTDESAAIYKIKNNFNSIERVVYGKQIYRSCVLFPLETGLLYATDSQYESNTIRLLSQKSGEWVSEFIFDINGPCIFGTEIDKTFYFSTSVEGVNSGNLLEQILRNSPGPGIKKNQSEIIAGNLDKGFKTIYFNKKDILPYMLFQFGNINFPSGKNESKKLFFTNIALKTNDFSTKIIKHEV